MPAVGHIVRDFVLSVDGQAYECATTEVVSTITQNTQEIRTACPDGVAVIGDKPVESLAVSYNVAHEDAAFYIYLRDHIGDTASVSYTSSDGKRRYTGNVTIGPPTAAATVGDVSKGQVTLTVVGGLLTGAAVTP
jgi:hypothetical protein